MDMDQDFRSGLRPGEYRDALIVASEDWLVREAVSRILGAAFPGVTVDSLPTTPPPGPNGMPIICGIRLLADAPSTAAAGFASGNPWAVLLADMRQVTDAEIPAAEARILTEWRNRPDLIISAVGEQLRGRQATRSGSASGRRNPALRLLTRRQLEVVRLIAQGKPNAEIATTLGMSENTVRIHVSAILKTLGLANRTQAALWATQNLASEQAAG
ncbi:response regulator transcription factor [Pedomonas sp. V897]|uniref:helix-turn-helix transcriptional regulator n=1 Tax=Pedomonas sp. V897 TaxID=3446482 RepID=UPI003EE28BB0